jgi:hypothetical protein
MRENIMSFTRQFKKQVYWYLTQFHFLKTCCFIELYSQRIVRLTVDEIHNAIDINSMPDKWDDKLQIINYDYVFQFKQANYAMNMESIQVEKDSGLYWGGPRSTHFLAAIFFLLQEMT